MKKLFLILISNFILTLLYSQQYITESDSVPNETSCYRFEIDTTKHFSVLETTPVYDSANNILYYKISQSYTVKEWSKYYGYTKVWWIDFTDYSWKNRWLLGYYYKYIEKYHYYEIIYYDSLDKQKSIDILQNILNR